MTTDVTEILYFFGFKVVFTFLYIGNNDSDNRKLKINLVRKYCAAWSLYYKM